MSKITINLLMDQFKANRTGLLPALTIKTITRTNTDWRFVANINANSYLFILLPCIYPYPSIIKRWLTTPGYTNETMLLLSSYIPMGAQEYLDKQNINFVDLSGNCRIKRTLGSSSKKQNVFIRVSGRPNAFPVNTKAVDVYAGKSSRIIRALLINYPKTFLAIDLAKMAKVSPALVTKILTNLVEQGFLIMERRKGVRVIEPDLLLDEWATRYLQKRKVVLGRYYLDTNQNENLVKKSHDFFSANTPVLTGSAGASLIAPFADVDLIELYLAQPLQNNTGLVSVERGENIRIYQPYDDQVMELSQMKNGMRVADNLQLYLDLISNPRRGKEQATYLREQVIKFV